MENSQFLSPVILMLKKNQRQHLHLTHCITPVSACVSNDTFGLKAIAYSWISIYGGKLEWQYAGVHGQFGFIHFSYILLK